MNRIITLLLILLFTAISFADEWDVEHGMYMLTVKNIQGDINEINGVVKNSLKSAGFNIISEREMLQHRIMLEKMETISADSKENL